jgi:heptosyltransferase-2
MARLTDTPELRIAVRGPNWIGDQVMAFPFYRALRERFPRARLTLVAPESVAGLPVPGGFEETVVIARRGRHSPWQIAALARRLAAFRFDASYSLAASFSAALPFFAARIPRRIGFCERSARWLFTEPIAWPGRSAGRHKSDLYRSLAGPLPPSPAEPASALAEARENLIVLAPAASIRLREWPYFSELLGRLSGLDPRPRIAVVGSPADRRWETVLGLAQRPEVENWIGRTSLEGLTSLCRRARLVIANDSGVAHVAATLAGAPTIVLFGPGDPRYVGPHGPRVETVRAASVACSPCESARCAAPYGYQTCLRALGVDQVWVKVAAFL